MLKLLPRPPLSHSPSMPVDSSFSVSDMIVRGLFGEPEPGTTLAGEIKCYSLPYGGLGFASHILAYYTIIVLALGYRPLRPWQKLTHSTSGMIFGLTSLLGGMGFAAYTTVRCRNRVELLLIAVWKMGMSAWNGIVGFHTALIIRSRATYTPAPVEDEPEKSSTADRTATVEELASSLPEVPQTYIVLFWVILYVPFMVAGFIGLISLMKENWVGFPADNEPPQAVAIITYAFVGTVVLFFLLILLVSRKDGNFRWLMAIGGTSIIFTMLSALWCDWELAALVNNLSGVPSGDVTVLYWSYFTVKRLPMLSY